jgi:hypothetical protein
LKTNLWIYADKSEQSKTAFQILIFGADIFKRAKSIRDYNKLKKIKKGLDSGLISPQETNIEDFILEYLIDCVRFMIFFENYMKAKLIEGDFCIHVIKGNQPEFKTLANQQKSRPIRLREIHDIENFIIDRENRTIYHNALLDKTVGVKELLKYAKKGLYFNLESTIINLFKGINEYRNMLHFRDTIEFELSETFLTELEKLNQFVDKVINEKISDRAQ